MVQPPPNIFREFSLLRKILGSHYLGTKGENLSLNSQQSGAIAIAL